MTDNYDYLHDPTLGEDALQVPARERSRFGILTVYAMRVKFEKGAEGYTVPGALNFDGSLKKFAGKVPDRNSKQIHVVMVLEQFAQDGSSYTRNKNWMTFDADYAKTVKPALDKVFGNPSSILGKPQPVRVLEVPNGREYEGKPLVDWAVEEKFPTKDAMLKASEEFYAQFGHDENGEGGAAGNPYEWLFTTPAAYADDESVFMSVLPDVMALVATITKNPTPAALWKTDPAVKELNDSYAVTPEEAVVFWENREAISNVPSF